MEYDTVYDITDSQDTSGEKIEQEENESGITIEEAGNMIDSFLKETGFSSIPQTESSQLKWSGYNERADQVYQEDDIHECVSGYRFYYNIGVGKILFDDAFNPIDLSAANSPVCGMDEKPVSFSKSCLSVFPLSSIVIPDSFSSCSFFSRKCIPCESVISYTVSYSMS